MYKRTRFKLTVAALITTSYIGITATYKELEGVALAALGILGGIITYYTKKESETPSQKRN